MNKILIIIKREYIEAVKKKTFIVMTILGPILMSLLILTPVLLDKFGKDKTIISVLDESKLFTDLDSPNDKSIRYVYTKNSLDELKKDLINKEIDVLLYIPQNMTALGGMVYTTSSLGSGVMSNILASMKRNLSNIILLHEFNISQDSLDVYINSQTNKIMLGQTFIDKNGEESHKNSTLKEMQVIIGFILGILIYIFIFMYCSMVLRNVLEEKTNRIVEIIVSSVKPIQLMIGKIIGVALIGFTQLMIWVLSLVIILGIVKFSFPNVFTPETNKVAVVQDNIPESYYQYIPSDNKTVDANINNIVENDFISSLMSINFTQIIFFFLFFFVCGYFLYASLYAAIGGAVDNETDTQQFMLPLTLPLLLTFVAAQYIAENPDGAVAFWFSIIPFTSPIAMLIRIPFGIEAVQTWEIILSCSLMVIGCIASVWFASKIYRTGILLYGKKITYKELWKWIRYKNW